MRWTQTLIPTQKQPPSDAQVVSHQLLVRAGFIRLLTAGVYDLLPLGLRSLKKAEAIIRQEMDRIGCAELLLPTLQPLELWQQTGRDQSYGENLMRVKDRHGRQLVLGPTHEEVITELARAFVSSYKQLPLRLYQIQTKFRDEYRPRFGLLRVREFPMKDAYSLHATSESLDEAYDAFYGAYERIFTRCGLPFVVVEAESGPIGGSASHEFMAACPAGEDTILASDKGNYAANVEKCRIGRRDHTFGGEPTGTLEKVHTPDMPGIETVGRFLKVKPRNMLKTLVFKVLRTNAAPVPGAGRPENLTGPSWLVAVVRGDHEVNEAKLKDAAAKHFQINDLQLVDDESVRKTWAIGFVGPDKAVQDPTTVVLVDPDAAQGGFWCTGANEVDHHVKHFNWFRDAGDQLADPRKVQVDDIRNALEGDPSPLNDGGVLRESKGIELGHVFKLGTKYSAAMDATFLDEQGQSLPIIMGCYGIGVGRILIAAVEAFNDERGILWPVALAPYSVVITPIQYEGEMKSVADTIYRQLTDAGIDTLLDDRDARPGSKFADADLIGIPLRVTVGDRGLKEGKVELKRRSASDAEMVRLDQLLPAVRAALGE